MKRLFACLAAALILAPALPGAAQVPSLPAAGGQISVPPIAYHTRTLPNGLKVFSALDRTTTNVTIQVWYGVGSKDDPQGRSGFAHLFEHMMFKATHDMPAEFMDRLTEDVGGMNNASTADDFTNYFEVVPANHLERLLWAEAERMSALTVDEANFHSERQVVEEELRQRVLADPYGRFTELALPEATFTVHPYARPGIGNIADLDSATLADVRNFHATYYRPDDAALIVVGNFDPAQLDAWIDRYFGPITSPAAAIPRVTAVEPPRTGPRSVTAYGPNVPLPALAITWLAPAASSPDAPALTVLDAILSTGDSSRLFQSMVYQQQSAQSVFSGADLRQQPGMFYVGAVMAGGKAPAAGEAALLAEVEKVRTAPVSPAELDKAKSQLIADALRGRETVEGRGYSLGYAYWVGGDVERANSDIARLQAVTAADVLRVAQHYLAPDQRVTVTYVSDNQRPANGPPPVGEGASARVEAHALAAVQAPAPPAQPAQPPQPAAPLPANLPAAAERTLPNGLRVIVARSGVLPLVSAQLMIGGGGAADPEGKAGLADMTASLITEGAAGRSATDLAQAVEALGAKLDTGATWDGSYASLSITTAKLDPAMAILADMVRKPDFAAEELERLRARELDSLTVNLQEPGNLARYMAAESVFAGTPYGHLLNGTPKSLKAMTRADIVALHQTWYRPDNAILVLTGDITPDAGFALAQKAFGGWTRPSAALPRIALPAPSYRPRVIVIDLPGAGQAAVTLSKPGIARSDPRFYAAMVANAVLGGGYSARLNEEVRVKRGLSYGANSAIDARRGVGPFVATAQTKNESAPQVVDLMLAQMGEMASAPASSEELAVRKAALIGGFGRRVETTGGLSGYLAGLALQDVSLSEINRYQANVEAISADAAQAFAAADFDPKQATIVVAGDAKVFIDKLRAVYPDLQLIPAANLDLDHPALR